MIFRLLEIVLALLLLIFLVRLIVSALTESKKTNEIKNALDEKERELRDEQLLDHLQDIETKIVEKQKKRTES